MGDTSIIARRLRDGHVQYGWSGNGGYFRVVGSRLLRWYQNPEEVEYLFGLGQTRLIGRKGSEYGGCSLVETHDLTGEAFWLGTSEKEIFSKIAFADYGYFYDLDSRWYYIIPGPFRIKMPLEFVAQNVDDFGYEFELRRKVEDKILRYMFSEYLEENKDFADFLNKNKYDREDILQNLIEKDEYEEDEEDEECDNKVGEELMSIMNLYDKYNDIFRYFDDWILVRTNDENTEFSDIVLNKKGCVFATYDQSIFMKDISQGKLEMLQNLVTKGLLDVRIAISESGLSEAEFTKLLNK